MASGSRQDVVDGLARMQRAVGVLEHHLHQLVEGLVALRAPSGLAGDARRAPLQSGLRPAMARSTVDLPEPDSPTRPKVSPSATLET